MIIAIAGFTASGKTSLGKALSQRLSLPLFAFSFKDWAKKEGISERAFLHKAENDPNIDLAFDKYQKEVVEEKGEGVVTTWIGAWMIDVDVRVFLNCPLDVRVERAAQREHLTLQQAREYVLEKDDNNVRRYKRLYNLDLRDVRSYEHFDIFLNSSLLSIEELTELVVNYVKR